MKGLSNQDRLVIADLAWVMRVMAERSGICIPEMPEGLPGRFGNTHDSLEEKLGPRSGGKCDLIPGSSMSGNVVQAVREGDMGMAAVHISVIDITSKKNPGTGTPAAVPNQRVILDVAWQSSDGGGNCQVDASQGTMFTVAGANSVQVSASLVAQGPGAFVAGNAKRVEGAIQWGSTISRPAFMTTPRVALVATIASTRIQIPRQASQLMIFADNPGATVVATFFGAVDATAGRDALYSASFTNTGVQSTKVPVVMGAETVDLTSTLNCNAFLCAELYL